MANFWDLPESVRQQIYRLHLVQEKCIKYGDTRPYSWCWQLTLDVTGYRKIGTLWVPAIFLASRRAQEEAAVIYYGENNFDLGDASAALYWHQIVLPKHIRFVKKATCTWRGRSSGEGFQCIARKFKGLQELYIRVDEAYIVQQQVSRQNRSRSHFIDVITPQQNLSVRQSAGYTGLLRISGIPHVEFIKLDPDFSQCARYNTTGPIPGGFLQTYVIPMLQGRTCESVKIGLQDDSFPFLSLPPEVRNRIYNLLLCIPGKVHPSPAAPSSKSRALLHVPHSALSIVATNKQVRGECQGIFYSCNQFEFYFPTQFSAFTMSLSPERIACVHDVTIHYYKYSLGGISLAELIFPTLRQLPGLRRLEIIVDTEMWALVPSMKWTQFKDYDIQKANPLRLPGIGILFTLRGLTHVKVRYTDVERELDGSKMKRGMCAKTSIDPCIERIGKALEHFNRLLAKAQTGEVDKRILSDPQSCMLEVFPTQKDGDES